MKKSPAVSLFLWVILLLVCSGVQGETINIVPSPAWVVEIPVKTPLKIPEDDIRGGIHYLLIDRQLKVNDADGQVVSSIMRITLSISWGLKVVHSLMFPLIRLINHCHSTELVYGVMGSFSINPKRRNTHCYNVRKIWKN